MKIIKSLLLIPLALIFTWIGGAFPVQLWLQLGRTNIESLETKADPFSVFCLFVLPAIWFVSWLFVSIFLARSKKYKKPYLLVPSFGLLLGSFIYAAFTYLFGGFGGMFGGQ